MSTKVKKFVKIRSVRFCLGCLFAAAAFAISVLAYDKAKAGLFFAVLFLLAGAVKIPDTLISRRGLTVLYTIWLVLTAFATLFFSQFCLNEALPDRGFFVTLLGTLLILCLYLIPFVFTLKIRVCVTVVSAILILFTCLNYFVFLFRGSEIAPADLLSVTAAGNVAAEYSFRIPAAMFYALILSVIYYSASFALPAYVIDKKKKTRIVGSLIALVFAVAVWIGGLGVQPLHWRQTWSANNGYLLNFTVLFRESFPQKPSRYSPEIVRAIAEQYETERIKDYAHMPDIIVIMDESLPI